MQRNTGVWAFILAVFVASAGLAAHSPTAWTQGHYTGEEVTAEDVVAYWSFDEPEQGGVALAADHSGNGHILSEHPKHAKFHSIGEGRVGGGLVCANTTNAMPALRAVSEEFNLKHAFTVEMWFKLPKGAWAGTPEKRVYYLFNIDDFCNGGRNTAAGSKLAKVDDGKPGSYRLPFYTNAEGQVKTRWPVVTIPDDAWTHAAFTWDGRVARTYLNGALVAEWKQEKSALVDAGEIWIGSYYWGGGFEGAIDSVRVLDRAIAFAEPGKQPAVQPRNVRNAAVAAKTRKKTSAQPKTWVKTGDLLNLDPLYVSHGRAVAKKVARPPRVDGRLDDAAWKSAAAYGQFMHNTGHYAAKDQTEFRVCYDDENLYLGVTAFDQNVKLIRNQVPKEKRDGPVYYDDSVEFFLDTNGDRKTYYHIVVNANGAVYDAWRKPKSDGSWNGVSQSAGAVGDGQWSAELAIPFSALGVESVAQARSMGFNVGREQYSRDGHLLAQWVSCLNANGGFHSPNAFGLLVLGDAAETRTALNAASLRAEWKDGKLILNLPLDRGKAFKGRALAEFSNRELRKWSEASAELSGKAGLRQAVALDPQWKRCFVRLSLFDAKAENALPTDMLVAGFDLPELLKLRLTQPHYRNNLYADQKLEAVVAEVHSALPHAVAVAFGPAGGEPTFTRRLDSARKPTDVSIPAAGLAEGAYELTATLVNKDGKAISGKAVRLRKLPAHANAVRLREDGIWLRRGKPFMPVGWFGLSLRSNGPTVADLVKAQGVNAGLTYMYRKGNDRNLKALLDECAKQDVALLVRPCSDLAQKERGLFKMSDAVRAEVTERVNRLKDHPGLLGWYMADEPEINNTTVSWLKDMYDLICELDPYHPCVILNDTLPGVTQYAVAADISMPDPYVVPLKVGPPSSALTKIAAFMDAVAATGKTAWITPEAFNYGFVNERHALARAVNATEQRCIAFLAMAHGCRGYLYYSLGYILPEPELFVGMPHLIRELVFVSKMFTETGTDLEVASGKPVRAFARKTDGAFLLVAVNPSMASVESELRCPELPTELAVLSENRTVRPTGGVIRDRFEPYGVHVYTTLPGAAALPTVDAVKAEVVAYKQRLADENRDNLAFAGNGATVTAAAYSKAMYLNDGTVNHPNWQFSPKPGKPAWAEVAFPKSATVSRIVLDATPFQYFATRTTDAAAFVRVQGKWRQVGKVENNDKPVITFSFDPIATDAIRIESPQTKLVLWAEIRAFAR